MPCLLCKQLAGAADETTDMHAAHYATDDNRQVLCLCTDLHLKKSLSFIIELDALPFQLCLN